MSAFLSAVRSGSFLRRLGVSGGRSAVSPRYDLDDQRSHLVQFSPGVREVPRTDRRVAGGGSAGPRHRPAISLLSPSGLDAYLKSPNCDPRKLLETYEQLSRFDLPLYITEITIPSAGEGGEALQAEVVRDHYRLWFSAPKMAGITWWNLGDGTAVQGENEARAACWTKISTPNPPTASWNA